MMKKKKRKKIGICYIALLLPGKCIAEQVKAMFTRYTTTKVLLFSLKSIYRSRVFKELLEEIKTKTIREIIYFKKKKNS